MKNKYDISSEFNKIKNFYPPFSKAIFPFANLYLSLYPVISDDKTDVKHIKIKSTDKKCIGAVLITPKNAKEKLPCLVYFHGGGFSFKASPFHYKLLREYAIKTHCAVLAADYRNPPRYKFPTPLNDCFSAYRYAVENAEELSFDKNKIAVGGDSAGGNLAAAVTLLTKENSIQAPLFALFIYPALDATMSTESMKTFVDTPMWNAALNEKMWKYYLPCGESAKNPLVSPLFSNELSSFPPTYVETAEFDCLKDESLLFAEKLKENGVEVFVNNTCETVHGFDNTTWQSTTLRAIEKRTEFMKNNFFGK